MFIGFGCVQQDLLSRPKFVFSSAGADERAPGATQAKFVQSLSRP